MSARPLLFEITKSQCTGHHHSLLYTVRARIHLETFMLQPKWLSLGDNVKLCFKQNVYCSLWPTWKQQSSVFNTVSYHLWALFKVLHIRLEIRNREERSVGEQASPWFMCQTQHWSSDPLHTRSPLLVDDHLSPLNPPTFSFIHSKLHGGNTLNQRM